MVDVDIDAVVEKAWSRLPQVQGVITSDDAKFLLRVVAEADARHVIEVGVASGSSSNAILCLFAELGENRALYGFDLLESFYGDPDKPIGFITREDPVSSKQNYRFFGGSLAADIGVRLAEAELENPAAEVAFIDAHHCHPWAALDTLCVLPFLRPDGWIVLHDTNLPKIRGARSEFGPRTVFDDYRGEKREAPGELPNIAAIRLSGDPAEIDSIIDALDSQWEFAPEWAHLERIHAALSGCLRPEHLARVGRALAEKANFHIQ